MLLEPIRLRLEAVLEALKAEGIIVEVMEVLNDTTSEGLRKAFESGDALILNPEIGSIFTLAANPKEPMARLCNNAFDNGSVSKQRAVNCTSAQANLGMLGGLQVSALTQLTEPSREYILRSGYFGRFDFGIIRKEPGLVRQFPKEDLESLIAFRPKRKLDDRDLLLADSPTPMRLSFEGLGASGGPSIDWNGESEPTSSYFNSVALLRETEPQSAAAATPSEVQASPTCDPAPISPTDSVLGPSSSANDASRPTLLLSPQSVDGKPPVVPQYCDIRPIRD